jgi:hypothetical protein
MVKRTHEEMKLLLVVLWQIGWNDKRGKTLI